MADLKNILAFLLREYPKKSDLSNARVTKMVYLADWHQAIKYNNQISTVDWYFDNYGPFVWDIWKTIQKNHDLFSCEDGITLLGQRKITLGIKDKTYRPVLSDNEKASLKHVINETSSLDWNSFIRLVYSTYPIITSERYSSLNLVKKAEEYALT